MPRRGLRIRTLVAHPTWHVKEELRVLSSSFLVARECGDLCKGLLSVDLLAIKVQYSAICLSVLHIGGDYFHLERLGLVDADVVPRALLRVTRVSEFDRAVRYLIAVAPARARTAMTTTAIAAATACAVVAMAGAAGAPRHVLAVLEYFDLRPKRSTQTS